MKQKRASKKKAGVSRSAAEPPYVPGSKDAARDVSPPAEVASSQTAPVFSDIRAYLVLAVVCLLCHGFILTNNGTIWDGWYWLEWLKHKNWAPIIEYTASQGLPFHRWMFGAFAFLPDIVGCGMFLNVLCLYLESVLTYRITLKISRFNPAEALAIAALSQALPFFNASQDFPVFGLIFFRLLFLFASLLAFRGLESGFPKNHIFRLITLGLMVLCCLNNGALLVFYGGFYILLLFHYLSIHKKTFQEGAVDFLIQYPDYFLLPPLTFLARHYLVIQFGWYESYNKPTSDIVHFWPNLGSFFSNLLGYHVKYAGNWILNNLLVCIAFLGIILFLAIRFKENLRMFRSEKENGALVAFGGFLLCLALFPLAMVGKAFLETPVSIHSRHCLLVNLPLALLVFALLRLLFFAAGKRTSALFIPVTALVVCASAVQLNALYLTERVEWIYRHSALHNIKNTPITRESTVLLLQNYSTTGIVTYDLYGAAGAFGSLTRFVTPLPPGNRRFYTPSEIYFGLLMTSLIPNEFRQVNPSGRQLVVTIKHTPPTPSPMGMAWDYVRLRLFAPAPEFETYLASLTKLDLGLLKEASPLIPGLPRDKPQSPPQGVPHGEFDNGIGMPMVPTPQGWWAGKFEVTQAEYQTLMKTNPSLFPDPVRPVECVSWVDAMEFCRRLTQAERDAGRLPTGFVYRLPTNQEWETLAAGTQLSAAVLAHTDPLWHTEPVGSKAANPLGLHDVLGNVWEWCLDWSDSTHRYKISRGGGWINHPSTLAPYAGDKSGLYPIAVVATERLYGPVRKDYPDQGFWERGFRCVLAPAVPEPSETQPGG